MMSVAVAPLFSDLAGSWFAVSRADARAAALYRRHYSARKNAKPGIRDLNFMGPGECLVLLTADSRAVFAWQRNVGAPRLDHQEGVCCTLFRNEGSSLSSVLIREADAIADRRWPGARHFTYVDADATKTRRSRTAGPGHCFVMAGWRRTEHVSTRGLVLLERC